MSTNTQSAADNTLYPCKVCNQSFDMNFFNKTQINKFTHGKLLISQLTCKSCVSVMESADKVRAAENEEKRKQHMLMEEAKKADKALKDARRESEQKERMLKKEKQDQVKMEHDAYKNDPSLQFIKTPLKIPIVTESKAYFHNLKTGPGGARMVDKEASYKVELNGPHVGWRAVAKLAVRHNHKYREKDGISSTNKRVLIGLFAPNSHEILPNCLQHPSHHAAINRAVGVVDYVCNKLNKPSESQVTGFVEVSGKHRKDGASAGLLRYILLSVQNSNNKVQLTLIWNADRLSPGGVGGSAEDKRKQAVLAQFVNDLVFYGEEANRTEGSERTPAQGQDNSDDSGVQLQSTTLESSTLFHNIWVNYNEASTHVNRITDYDADNWQLVFPTTSRGDVLTERSIEHLIADHSEAMLGEQLTGVKFHNAEAEAESFSPIQLPKLFLPPFVFRQANLAAFQAIITDVLGWVRSLRVGTGTEHERKAAALNMLELYGGVGTIGLSLYATPDLIVRNAMEESLTHSQLQQKLLAVTESFINYLHSSDENPHNKACFERTVCETPCLGLAAAAQRLQYTSLSATDMVSFPSLIKDGCGPAAVAGLRGYHVVLVDPPRKGLDVEVREALCGIPGPSSFASSGSTPKHNKKRKHQSFDETVDTASVVSTADVYPQRLIYISCGFKAFQRDCDYLLGVNQEGSERRLCRWKLIHCHGYVLFPGSNHVETLAIFDRVME